MLFMVPHVCFINDINSIACIRDVNIDVVYGRPHKTEKGNSQSHFASRLKPFGLPFR